MSAPTLAEVAPWTRRIIIINCAIALLSELLSNFSGFNPIREWMPLRLGDFVGGAFWQVFTYMWVHAELVGVLIIHLLFNMITLYFVGKVVEYRLGSKPFLWLYLTGGLVAVSFFLVDEGFQGLVLGQIVEMERPLVGASGAVCAVLGAFSLMMPDAKVYIMFLPFPIRAITAVKGFVVFSLIATVLGMVPGLAEADSWQWLFSIAHSAHLGGVLCGWWVARHAIQRASPRQVVTPPPIPFDPVEHMSPEEIRNALDPILDKIGAQGMEYLTARERRILERARELFG